MPTRPSQHSISVTGQLLQIPENSAVTQRLGVEASRARTGKVHCWPCVWCVNFLRQQKHICYSSCTWCQHLVKLIITFYPTRGIVHWRNGNNQTFQTAGHWLWPDTHPRRPKTSLWPSSQSLWRLGDQWMFSSGPLPSGSTVSSDSFCFPHFWHAELAWTCSELAESLCWSVAKTKYHPPQLGE